MLSTMKQSHHRSLNVVSGYGSLQSRSAGLALPESRTLSLPYALGNTPSLSSSYVSPKRPKDENCNTQETRSAIENSIVTSAALEDAALENRLPGAALSKEQTGNGNIYSNDSTSDAAPFSYEGERPASTQTVNSTTVSNTPSRLQHEASLNNQVNVMYNCKIMLKSAKYNPNRMYNQ